MVHALSIPNIELLDQFHLEADVLPDIVAKKEEIAARSTGPKWALVDNMVVRCDRLFLPSGATGRPQVLEHAHGMGHEDV
jgi:hypothetical protein